MIRLGPLHLRSVDGFARDFDAHASVLAGGRLRRFALVLPTPGDVLPHNRPLAYIERCYARAGGGALVAFWRPSEAEVVAYQLAEALRERGYPAVARGASVGLAGAFDTK